MDIRPARVEDAETISEIYNLEVRTGTSVFDIEPRSLEQQRRWLTERSGVHAVLVADHNDAVVGFAALSPFKERPCYRTTVESSVYIATEHRRRGIGRTLLGELVQVATDHGFHTMIARIEGSNEASVELHRGLGFDSIGTEREVGRKFGRWLDVHEMQLMLSSHQLEHDREPESRAD